MKGPSMDEDPIIERSKWHKPSYLGHYGESATHYEGIRTRCLKCGTSFVFSARDQKQAFETEHRYPGFLPSLCPTCSGEWQTLEQRISGHPSLFALIYILSHGLKTTYWAGCGHDFTSRAVDLPWINSVLSCHQPLRAPCFFMRYRSLYPPKLRT